MCGPSAELVSFKVRANNSWEVDISSTNEKLPYSMQLGNGNLSSKKKYKKIVKQSKFWPIVQLFKDRKGFMNEVSQKSQNKILEKIKPEELYDELINTVYKLSLIHI